MPAVNYDFEIEQGTTQQKVFGYKAGDQTPINLTGFTARMQIRPKLASDVVLLELSTTNGRLQLGGIAGTVTMLFAPATTTGVPWSRGVYDLELTSPDGAVTRMLMGEITLSKEVTRG
jgi:hypothetical protein